MDNMLDLTPAEALERLRACYSAHVERFVQAGRAGDWRDKLAGWLSGGGGMARRAQDEALSSFYQDLKLGVEALSSLLAGIPDAAPFAAEALELVLFHSGAPDPSVPAMEFALVALEGLADPLIPLLDREHAQAILARYVRRTPVRRMLPNQQKLYQHLKRQADS